MVAKRKLTIETLTKLGRRKLAELLIAEAAGNRQLKQTLNLAIAAEAGPEVLGASLRKRLTELTAACLNLIEQAHVLDGDHGLVGKVVASSICLVVNG